MSAADGGFDGLCVVSFESRRAREMTRMIEQFGGRAVVAPSMQEVPLEDQREALEFGEQLLAGQIDVLVLLTGVGTRTLVQALSTRSSLDEITQAFETCTLVTRGPKPVAALSEMGLKPNLKVSEPNTWHEILEALDTELPVKGLRVAVQEYGITNRELLDGLTQRGAHVLRVPVYRWALPDDRGPLEQAIHIVCAGSADVLLFTSATQVHHVLQVASELGVEDAFRDSARQCVISSIGPVCSGAIKDQGLHMDMEPTRPKLGHLLRETSQRCHGLLKQRRAS